MNKIDASDCENFRITFDDFCFEFDENVEETYVVKVTISNKVFYVNCQREMTNDYKTSKFLSCTNESGSDYYESGLDEFVSENCEFLRDEIINRIEDCAQPFSEKTIEEFLEEKFDFSVTKNEKDRIFGACYANNCSFTRYDEKNGDRIIIVAEDSDENITALIVKACVLFDNLASYQNWYDKMKEESNENYGSCRLSRYAYENIVN